MELNLSQMRNKKKNSYTDNFPTFHACSEFSLIFFSLEIIWIIGYQVDFIFLWFGWFVCYCVLRKKYMNCYVMRWIGLWTRNENSWYDPHCDFYENFWMSFIVFFFKETPFMVVVVMHIFCSLLTACRIEFT